MKFLADMGVSPLTVQLVRQQGPVQTCRFQQRSVMDFFDLWSRYANEQALMAQSGHLTEPPSLIPSFET
ncbi:MAG: hypothetical protein F6J94_23225 [Moorea sp. SIO1F2]|uniref:Uncharacterized protein n=1 Tax=Moorena bouillonii PNG TaxID=568701 RepID=A0A1U7N0U2_9CYAN|nr:MULTISPECIES: hypothetical protein [Moorena]NEN96335.1 hypothetical protein [Moorena sp. SIO3I7]NEO66106.1 hypothetical protein [Moorena sp. SIO4G2]NEQ79649.1 hypothetical protein [Moorena sp. SIO2I5]NEO07651.1 hypothetical protein [Moorena sp. SIO3I8]NEO15262.1 hypothetical protein [Moorena sp. SIO3E8]